MYLAFDDSKQVHYAETIAGYIESGYCGEINVRVAEQGIRSTDDSFAVVNWKSWFGFL